MITTQKIIDEMIEIEIEYNLFNIEIDSFFLWEYIRPKIWQQIIYQNAEERASAEDYLETNYGRIAYHTLTHSIKNNPIFKKDKRVIFHGFNRRKKLDDGYYWCLHCDHVAEEINHSWMFLENPRTSTKYLSSGKLHDRPAKTESIYYTDFFTLVPPFLDYIGISDKIFNLKGIEIPKEMELAELYLEQEFGVELDISSMITSAYMHRKMTLPVYKHICKRVNPDVVILTNRTPKLPFIEACSINDIPVVELQQGAIHYSHPGYSYPEDIDLHTLPDYYFTFGEYWEDNMDLPIPDSNIISVGWPYLDSEKSMYESPCTGGESIVVISQPTYSKKLALFAVELSEVLPGSYEVIFKPHPNSVKDPEDICPKLVNSSVTIDEVTPLYDIFSTVSAQVGISSTAIFEGITFDLQTYLLQGSSTSYIQGLVDIGAARIVTSPTEVNEHIDENEFQIDKRVLFEEDALENILSEIDKIIQSN